ELYDAALRAIRWVVAQDADGDGWPEGSGNVERPGMGQEKLDVAVYTIRGLRDIADLAASRGDTATANWANTQAAQRQARFEQTSDPAGNKGPSCDSVVSSVQSDRETFSLNTAIMAVGEGNYGRLAQQRFYTTGNARIQLDPSVWEMPGAMPEIAPSPDFPAN